MDRDNFYRRNQSGPTTDEPPMSRLFIIGPNTLTEQDYRKHFEEFGNIEELWMVRDKNTGDFKGITYIKFSKTSEAAKALESMNGASLEQGTRRIKVMIASSRDQGSKRETFEEEKTQRLFIVCPKSATEEELYDYFKQFGDLDYVNLIHDRATKESKGIAYIKYHKFSHAAKAFEDCERKYKPVFAEPKKPEHLRRNEPLMSMGGMSSPRPLLSGGPGRSFGAVSPSFSTAGAAGVNEGYNKLMVIAHPDLYQDQLWKLFDIVPGLEYCNVRYEGGNARPARALGEVTYSSSQWAAHAKEKLHGFEYPPGFRLIVKPVFDGNTRAPPMEKPKKDLLNIAETLAQASSLIQAAGLNPAALLNLDNVSGLAGDKPLDCSVELPAAKPLAGIDEECKARCFVVCAQPLPNTVLRDIFCRFGNLIEAYMLANRNCGYARYADQQSAEAAIETLHGAEINGIRIKVMTAEEPRKRQRTDEF